MNRYMYRLYSTDLLKGKWPTCVKSKCNVLEHTLIAMYLPVHKFIHAHTCCSSRVLELTHVLEH